MSELIDRIFDAEKISAEIGTILQELAKVEGAISKLKTPIKDVESEIRKAKGYETLAKSAKSLNDTVVQGEKEMKRWEVEVSKLNAKTAELTTTEKQAAIEIAKARLELQAAQKATKDAAIVEIELAAQTKGLTGSYNELQDTLKASIIAYKALSAEEAKGAKGKELLSKIQETQTALKASDAAMGNYQRNVGNYKSAVEGLTPKLGGLAGQLMDIAQAAVDSRDELNRMGGDNGLGVVANPRIPKGLATIMTGLGGIGQSVMAVGKAILANPIGVMIAVIAGAFALVNAAMKSNGQATEKLGQVLAPFKAILGAVLNVVGSLISSFLDGVLVLINFGNAVMSIIPGLDKVAEKNKQAIELEKEKQRLIKNGIVDKAADAQEELRLAELKKKMMEKDIYSAKERLAMAREIDRAEKAMALDDADRANKNLKAFLREMQIKGKAQKDYTVEELSQLADLQAAKYNEQAAYFEKTKKLAGKEAALMEEIEAEKKAAAEAEKERHKKILDARRRLIDSQFALLKDSQEKDIKISNEANKRKIEDLAANGELTNELRNNLEKAQQNEVAKIKKEWAVKNLNDSIKADELTLDNMKKAGQDTLAFEKELLKDRMKAEILAGGSELEIKQKYKFLELDLEAETADKKAALFEKELTKQTELLSSEYKKQEIEVKKQYADGKISKEKYESDIADIQLNALKDVNQKTIDALRQQLDNSELSADKRAELSKKLRDLEIENENAVVDATIKANEDKLKADADAAEKRKAIIMALANAGAEIFGAIADYQNQQSENRIAGLEAEQEKLDETFAKDQENLDNAIMSEETRAEKQKEINEKKAASEKEIADKIKEEKIKQAKWDKANAIVQAIIGTGLAIISGLKEAFPLNIIASGLAATMGAIQVATIASTPIPAYERGGVTGDGLALWGETRPEVAVDPKGNVMLAEKPTISNFDAGTRIYKSVSDYESAMSAKSGQAFKFDYDKMGEKIKSPEIHLDSRGLWGIVSKQQSRSTMINRKYRL